MMFKDKKNEMPKLTFPNFCAGVGSDGRELKDIGQKKWDLIKLYLSIRLREGGSFTYEGLARKAVRFACIISNTIEKMREETYKEYIEDCEKERKEKEEEERKKEEKERKKEERRMEYERSSPDVKERIYKEVLKSEQGFIADIGFFTYSDWLGPIEENEDGLDICGVFVPYAEYERLKEKAQMEIATYTPTQRYEIGMKVDYADLDEGSQEKVFQWWIEEMKKTSSSRRSSNVYLTKEEQEGFYARRNEILHKLSPFERAKWGEKVLWEDLSEEEKEILHQRYLGGDRAINNYKKGSELKNYHNYLISNAVMHGWKEEVKEIKAKGDNR